MKKIILIRHGKAEVQPDEITDFERSLTRKGKVVSKLMAQEFRKKGNSPGVIITSPAFRALETAIIFAEEFEIDPGEIIMNNGIYYKMNFHMLPEILSLVGEDENTVTLVGHNPSFTEIADILCKDGCGFFPKSGIIGISFNVMTWSEIRRNCGKTDYFFKPENVI
jgi:phosphohistidine phosphatase